MSTRTEPWSAELILRYVCATLVTWIAAAGAQLVAHNNNFVFTILLISTLGAPVSLYLRRHSMRVAGFSLSRPLWNSVTVLTFFICAGIWTVASMSDMIGLLLNGASQSFLMRFAAESSLGVLMQVFLLFAAFRSFSLISDKDATLTTVPSFSVLLLLVPVHKGIEVVLYFLLWTLVSTTLFALDHRGELHAGTNGVVAAPIPGQDVRLAARGLATVLGVALIAAFGLSGWLTSRNAEDKSATESEITALVGRLAQFAMNSPDASTSGGPDRQIDFSSGPSLPSRALLWKVVMRDSDNRTIRPSYFRLFTLSQYNGSTWVQATRNQKQISVSDFSITDWPAPPQNSPSQSSGTQREFGEGKGPRIRGVSGINRLGGSSESGTSLTRSTSNINGDSRRVGYALNSLWTENRGLFGSPTEVVWSRIAAYSINLGYLPVLPGTRSLRAIGGRDGEIRVGDDNSIDCGYIPPDQNLVVVSDSPALTEYGFLSTSPPSKAVTRRPDSPQLSGADREAYLKLPRLTHRTELFARNVLANAPASESALGKAKRLAVAIQRGATYTLHPPTLPIDQEATDFFLFDGNRRGYCTHFASALTVLCRSQGIPARIVSGFAAQEYSSDGVAQLREANAHAWTEVWIENWGWALVDATPSSDRGDNAPNFLVYWGDWFGFAVSQVEMWAQGRLLFLGEIMGTFIVAVYALRRRVRIAAWWARRGVRPSSDEWTRREVVAAYDSAATRVARLFRPRAAFETPDEWLAAANEALRDSARPKPFAYTEFERLTSYYLSALYAPQAPREEIVESARGLARHVRQYKKAASK